MILLLSIRLPALVLSAVRACPSAVSTRRVIVEGFKRRVPFVELLSLEGATLTGLLLLVGIVALSKDRVVLTTVVERVGLDGTVRLALMDGFLAAGDFLTFTLLVIVVRDTACLVTLGFLTRDGFDLADNGTVTDLGVFAEGVAGLETLVPVGMIALILRLVRGLFSTTVFDTDRLITVDAGLLTTVRFDGELLLDEGNIVTDLLDELETLGGLLTLLLPGFPAISTIMLVGLVLLVLIRLEALVLGGAAGAGFGAEICLEMLRCLLTDGLGAA